MRTETQILNTLACGLLSTTSVAADPYEKSDESWITLSGTVTIPTDDSFVLDYGEGMITVEVDDWDDYGEAAALMENDKVTVLGRVDDDLYESTTIEASSIYVENLGTYFYASAADEEDAVVTYHWEADYPIEVGDTTLRGTVTSVNTVDREFTIDTGARQVTVDASELGYNPFDDLGYQHLNAGDLVSVRGDIDYELFDGRELEAKMVITLNDSEEGDS